MATPSIWLLIRLRDLLCALPVLTVHSLVTPGPLTHMPQSPPTIRGLFALRGQSLLLIDLRRALGMPTLVDDIDAFGQLMATREQEHHQWLDALLASVESGVAFTGALSSHDCAFGRWYDQFKTEDWALGQLMRRFRVPHERLHATAGEVATLLARGESSAAAERIEAARLGEFAELQGLFRDAKTAYANSRREIAVVMDDQRHAMAVDDVLGIEPLEPLDADAVPSQLQQGHRACVGLAMWGKARQTVVLLDTELLRC